MRRIALVGTAPSSVHAPFDDESWEIWGVGVRADHFTRVDRWFELHRLDETPWAQKWRKAVSSWTDDCELWMLFPENLGPKVVQYPFDKIAKKFGTFFLTSSFGWMMALAIDEMMEAGIEVGVDEIGLWGVDMEYGTEYRSQRAGLRHFIDLARVLGIKVTRLASSGIVYEPVPYPLIEDDVLLQKLSLRERECQKKLDEWRNSLRETELMISYFSGILSAGENPDAEKKKKKLEATAEKLRGDIAWAEGVRSEQDWFADYLMP